MIHDEPRHLLVRARGEPSPLYEPEDPRDYEDLGAFTRNTPLNDDGSALPADLADALRSWSLSRPSDGFPSRRHMRKYVERGLEVARAVARHLDCAWVVRYWDEGQARAKFVCWGCGRLDWALDEHGEPPHPLHIVVEGEFTWYPLRAQGFGDFAPDGPVGSLHLSEELVAGLYAWSKSIDATVNLYLRDREEGKYDDEWQRQFREGRELARRVAHELGPARKVTYRGLANGGQAAMTSVTWQGDQEV
ncbi:hypothetical protein ACIOHS_24310 [Streptomyces sp. NPDC088253]|uniref:hypothetical protein n=1 Tax=Streptomyces sp. NPDC088253 TaxID=3365846 RepID=UPI0038029AB1